MEVVEDSVGQEEVSVGQTGDEATLGQEEVSVGEEETIVVAVGTDQGQMDLISQQVDIWTIKDHKQIVEKASTNKPNVI